MKANAGLRASRIRLTVLTPTHIGSGEKLDKSQYVYVSTSGKAYLLNESAWVKFLNQRRLLESFICQINRQQPNLWSWLQGEGVQERELVKLAQTVLQVSAADRSSLNNLHPMLRQADGQVYIPGSSIKGMLRTAILYHLIQNDYKNLGAPLWKEAEKYLYDGDKKEMNQLMLQWEEKLLHTLQWKNGRVQDAVASSLRGLRVGDVQFSQAATMLQRKIDWSTHKGRIGTAEKKLPLFRECIAPGSTGSFLLSLETSMLSEIGFASIHDIMAAARSLTQYSLKLQKDIFTEPAIKGVWQEAETADAIVGGGTGFLSKTLTAMLAPNPDSARQAIAAYLDKTLPAHHHKRLDGKLSPRTLKLAMHDSRYQIMGLCRLEEET